MTSAFPGSLDVIKRLENELDAPMAAFFNRLFAGIHAAQVNLGADPSDPGAAWPPWTSIADLLSDLFRIEQGFFTVETPASGLWVNGVEIDFANPDRFTDKSKMIVLPSYGGARHHKGGLIGYKKETVNIGGIGGRETYTLQAGDTGGITQTVNVRGSAGSPIGFTHRCSVYRNNDEGSWEFAYLAIQFPS